jgi:hypothetical protein
MKHIIMAVLLLAAVPSAYAGALDIDYLKPSPAKALAYSLVLPGGGYFYLDSASKNEYGEYNSHGWLSFVVGTASLVWAISEVRKGGTVAYIAAGAAIGFRIVEFGDVTTAAETDRHREFIKLTRDEQADTKKAAELPGAEK